MPLSFLSIVYGKPILPTSSNSPSPVPFLQGGGGVARAGGEDVTDKDRGKGGGESNDGQILPPPSVDNIPRPLSPTKLTPVGKYQRIKLNSSVRSHEFPLVPSVLRQINDRSVCYCKRYRIVNISISHHSPFPATLSEWCWPGGPPPAPQQRSATPEETELNHWAWGAAGAKHPKTTVPEVCATVDWTPTWKQIIILSQI